MRPGSKHYQVVSIHTTNYPGRQIPIVLLENGRPGYVINQWIAFLLEEEITPSQLNLYVRSLCHLYDFVLSQRNVVKYTGFKLEGRVLLADFIDAKKFGTDNFCISSSWKNDWLQYLGLRWKPLSNKKTIAMYIDAINQFDKWQMTFHQSEPINPSEEHILTQYEIYRDFVDKSQWDPFLHLHSAREHRKTEYQASPYGRYEHQRVALTRRNQAPHKAFPLNRFMDLIQSTENPRDKMLWLLMGAGSLRASETLHLFYSDLEYDRKHGGLKVLLEDPEHGYITYSGKTGEKHVTTRKNYLKYCYANKHFSPSHPLHNLQPRTLYGSANNRMYAGFKGMIFGENTGTEDVLNDHQYKQHDKHYLWWLDPEASFLFDRYFYEYQRKYFWGQPPGWPDHPWLFICTDSKNFGMPLSMSALEKSLQRALKRIGLEKSGLGLHSLRHMYGGYCANILKLSLETTQLMMHHASINSTQIYYGIEPSTVRSAIEHAADSTEHLKIKWLQE